MVFESCGSTANELTGTRGIPLLDGTHVGVGEFKSVVLKICWPSGGEKLVKLMYAVNLLFGSITARPIEFRVKSAGFGAGKLAPVTLVSVVEPVVVAKTLPSRIPTIRTLSSCGDTPIVVTTMPDVLVGFGEGTSGP